MRIDVGITGAAPSNVFVLAASEKVTAGAQGKAAIGAERSTGLPSVASDTRCREYRRPHELVDGVCLTKHESLVQNPSRPIGDGLWPKTAYPYLG